MINLPRLFVIFFFASDFFIHLPCLIVLAPNQTFLKMPGTQYWNNKIDSKKSFRSDDDKLNQILKGISKMTDSYEELSKKVNCIEEKLKNVNYCEEEVREVHFAESDKVDHKMIIDSGCPKMLSG